MQLSTQRALPFVLLLVAAAFPLSGRATTSSVAVADNSIRQFLERDHTQRGYKAARRLEAANGDRTGWVEAVTEYSHGEGFSYQITSEGGSDYIRNKVLRGILDGERTAILAGEAALSALADANYIFEPDGVDADGLAAIRLSPKRKERMLITGMMFLDPDDGALVRLQGRLAKSPSFWVKSVQIVRSYKRINNVVLPVKMETNARLRMLGPATLRMTYAYLEIDGHPAGAPR